MVWAQKKIWTMGCIRYVGGYARMQRQLMDIWRQRSNKMGKSGQALFLHVLGFLEAAPGSYEPQRKAPLVARSGVKGLAWNYTMY